LGQYASLLATANRYSFVQKDVKEQRVGGATASIGLDNYRRTKNQQRLALVFMEKRTPCISTSFIGLALL